MNIKKVNRITLILMLIVFVALIGRISAKDVSLRGRYPSLARPIAKEVVLITSAGQSTDTYMIKDIANKLMIHNFFMPQATKVDLEEISSLIVVVGYSGIGEKLHKVSFSEEKERVNNLLQVASEKNLPIITVHLGGELRMDDKTYELLKLTVKKSDYIIALISANKKNQLSDLAKELDIPLTLVKSVDDISEPFASAFR
jgi:hypothetical protein